MHEKKARQNRLQTNKKTIEDFLEIKIDSSYNTPTIGVCCSGGSFRAAVAALGLVKGLNTIGLLDAVTYFSALSGSTWFLASWLSQEMSLEKLELLLRFKLEHALSEQKLEEEAIAKALIHKALNGRHMSLADVWGSIMGNIFLDKNDGNFGQKTYLDEFRQKTLAGLCPIPLFTSVIAEDDYSWMEFTPFEVGSTYLHAWVNSDAFGKEFYNGLSSDKKDGESLSSELGVFGSAFALSIGDIWPYFIDVIKNYIPVSSSLPSGLSWLYNVGAYRFSDPEVNNPTYGLAGFPLENQKRITLIDAGLDCNLPMPPLLRRNVNLYIICDATADSFGGKTKELKKVLDFVKTHNIPFPIINLENIEHKALSIFYDEENPAAPVVIYIPNQFEVSTLDLDYDKQEFTGVVNSIETAVVQHAQTFKRALAYLIKNISDTKKAPKITLGKNKKVIQENQKDPTSKITQESLLIEP
jgi:phospholipase A2